VTGPISIIPTGQFASFGWAYRFTSDAKNENPRGSSGPDPSETIDFRYVPAEQAYEIHVPPFPRGRIVPLSYNGSVGNLLSTFNQVLLGNTDVRQDLFVTLPLPSRNTSLALTHTSHGYSSARIPVAGSEGRFTNHQGWFVFGVPTAPSDVPASGSASYRVIVDGIASLIEPGYPGYPDATVTFEADWSRGTVTGFMDVGLTTWDENYASLGRYAIKDGALAADRSAFSGRFTVPGTTAEGSFEGRFTGPQASELMVRWQAPYRDPVTNNWGTIFGIWVGRRA